MKLQIADIKLTPGLQIRVREDAGIISQYSELIKEGAVFPPLSVWVVEGEYHLIDGWHRYHAMIECGLTECECDVTAGGKAQALVIACEKNNSHGLRMSQSDKRKAILMLLKEDKLMSNNHIARVVGTSPHTVETVRVSSGLTTDLVRDKRGNMVASKKARATQKEFGKPETDSGDSINDQAEDDTGIGGKALSNDGGLHDNGNEPKMTKGEVNGILDIAIHELSEGGYAATAAKMMSVKVWVGKAR